MNVINLVPMAAPRPRFSKFGTYNNKKYTKYKEAIQKILKTKKVIFYSHNALELEVVFYMPIPKSLSKRKKEELIGAYHTKRPDTDNLLKALKDALGGLCYRDDAQVSVVSAKKIYALHPRIEFMLKEIDV